MISFVLGAVVWAWFFTLTGTGVYILLNEQFEIKDEE